MGGLGRAEQSWRQVVFQFRVSLTQNATLEFEFGLVVVTLAENKPVKFL